MTSGNFYRINIIDEEDWLKMQDYGAVFLPVTGLRVGDSDYQAYNDGFYWSASCSQFDSSMTDEPNVNIAGSVRISASTSSAVTSYTLINPIHSTERMIGCAVRLVTDVETNKINTQIKHATEGFLPGIFSISETEKVQFSQGNLRYVPAINEWSFHLEQYHSNGIANTNNSADSNYYLDLFGWGMSGKSARYPYSSSTYNWYYEYGNKDISGTDFDWALANPIVNGGNEPGMWRTMTSDEWNYLLLRRPNASSLVNLVSLENTIYGLMILPDDWIDMEDFTFKGIGESANRETHYYQFDNSPYSSNYITADQFYVMQDKGAVFLPFNGFRMGTVFSDPISGNYWSTSTSTEESDFAKELTFFNKLEQTVISPMGKISKTACASIRPVTPIISDIDTSVKEVSITDSIGSFSEVEIYDLMGRLIYFGIFSNRPQSLHGIHIVKCGSTSLKMVL